MWGVGRKKNPLQEPYHPTSRACPRATAFASWDETTR